jgi:uncharacterized protein YbjT (DUF2867 family)
MILVTGGTGFVGQEVVRKLLALGYPVRLLARHPHRAGPFPAGSRVEIVQGDALRPETLPAAMKDVAAVIHLIGIIAETSQVTYEQAHTEATRNVLAAAKAAGVTRWIQMSAIGTRPFASSRYHLTKWEAEKLVRNSGLDWTILRPSLVYGYDERDRLLNLMRSVLSAPLNFLTLYSLPLIDGGNPLIQPVSVREVALCFASAPAKEASVGKTIDLVGPVPFYWRDMVFKILAALGKTGTYQGVPILLLVRIILWLSVIALPLLIAAGLISNTIGLPIGELLAAFWVVLVVLAARWRKTLIFNLPGAPLIFLSEGLNLVAPRSLRPSEVLKMAVEDNVGDPQPAAKIFNYLPETFEEGLTRIYR